MTLAAPARPIFPGLGMTLRNRVVEPAVTTRPTPTTSIAARSIVMAVARDEGQFVATINEIPMFGEGDTVHEAAIDLYRSLVELRQQLRDRRDHLSPALLEQLAVLERLLF